MIDEIFRVLRLIRDSKTPPRTHEILQELRDISSMAMEHFDEKILPALKHSICTSAVSSGGSYDLTGGSLMIPHHSTSSGSSTFIVSHSVTAERWNKAFKKIYSKTKKNKLSFMSMKSRLSKMRLRMKRQGFHIRAQSTKLQQQAKKIQEQDTQLAEMKRHLEDWEQKMGDLTAELSRAREETQQTDSIEGCKRKHVDVINPRDTETSQSKELQAKKRKLIVERKSWSDAKDMKFKKFMSDLLCTNSSDECAPMSH